MHLGESNLLKKINTEVSSFDGWIKGIQAVLKKRLVHIPANQIDELFEEASARASEFIIKNEISISDIEELDLLIFGGRLLGLYRAITPILGQAAARSAISYAMNETVQGDVSYYLARKFGIFQEKAESAFDILSNELVKRSEEPSGKIFTLEIESRDEMNLAVCLKKCFFNDFFERSSAKELTYLICSIEDIWIEELERPKYGINISRSTTLADGAKACKYCLSRRISASVRKSQQ